MSFLTPEAALLIAQAVLLAWCLRALRKHGVGGHEVAASISTLALLRDPSFLSPIGRRYRVGALALFVTSAITAKLLSFLSQF